MKVINVTEAEALINDKQKSLEVDIQLYKNQEPLAAEIGQWGYELLEGVKNALRRKAFEATINAYKTGRNGD